MHVTPETMKVSTEYSLRWAEENPELFAKSVVKSIQKLPAPEWSLSVDHTRAGFLVLNHVRHTTPNIPA